MEDDVDYVVGTFSKSLGAVGGFMASNYEEFAALRLVTRPYMFTASLPPSVVASVTQAINVMARRPDLRSALWRNSRLLHAGLTSLSLVPASAPGPIVALPMPGKEKAVLFWNCLLAEGLYANLALAPATPGGVPLIRMSVTATLTIPQIEAALAAIRRAARATGLPE